MKIRIFGVRSFIVAVALSVSLGFVFPAFATTSVIVNPDGKVTYLGTFGWGIDDSGRVVGTSATTEFYPYHAFITGPNGEGMIDLNSLVGDLPNGGYLDSANGINNLGQVIATIAIPEPASYALMLADLGLVGFMVQRKMPKALFLP